MKQTKQAFEGFDGIDVFQICRHSYVNNKSWYLVFFCAVPTEQSTACTALQQSVKYSNCSEFWIFIDLKLVIWLEKCKSCLLVYIIYALWHWQVEIFLTLIVKLASNKILQTVHWIRAKNSQEIIIFLKQNTYCWITWTYVVKQLVIFFYIDFQLLFGMSPCLVKIIWFRIEFGKFVTP